MTTTDAARAREDHRRSNGEFGNQNLPEPDTTLIAPDPDVETSVVVIMYERWVDDEAVETGERETVDLAAHLTTLDESGRQAFVEAFNVDPQTTLENVLLAGREIEGPFWIDTTNFDPEAWFDAHPYDADSALDMRVSRLSERIEERDAEIDLMVERLEARQRCCSRCGSPTNSSTTTDSPRAPGLN